MAGEDEVLFKLGFESHPQAGAKIQSLIRAVEEAEKKIKQAFERIGGGIETSADRAMKQFAQMERNMRGDTGGPGFADRLEGEAKTVEQVSQRIRRTNDELHASMAKNRQQNVEGERLATDQSRLASEARRVVMIAEKEESRKRAAQIAKDIEMINQAQRDSQLAPGLRGGEHGGVIVMSDAEQEEHKKQLDAAIGRVKKFHAEQAKAAKEAARERQRLAAEEARDQREAIETMKAVQGERRRIEEQNIAQARNQANVWIEAYEKEQNAAERAMRSVARERRNLIDGGQRASAAIGRLTRASVLLGLAQGEQMEAVIRKLAAVQAGIDLVVGTGNLIRGASQAWTALLNIKRATVAATQANVAAGRLAVASSTDVQRALAMEALAARQAASAHGMLAAARGGGGVVGGVGRGVAAGAGGRVGGQVAGTATGAAVGTAGARAVGGAGARVAGTAMAAAFVAKAKVGAAAIGAAISAPVLAVAGTVSALILSPFVAKLIGERRQAAAGGARVEEMERERAEKQRQAEFTRMQKNHLDEMQAIKIEHENQRHDAQMKAENEQAEFLKSQARTPQERMKIINEQLFEASDRRQQAGIVADEVGPDAGRATVVAHEALKQAQENLISLVKQRGQAEMEIARQGHQADLDRIRSIEDVIRARQRESEELRNQFLSAKERFGQLDALEQERALRALEQAKRMKPEDITSEQARLVGLVGTDEAQGILRQRSMRRAEAAGFDQRAGGQHAQRQRDLEIERKRDEQRLARISGQDRADIGARARDPAQVEIVDRTQFQIRLESQEDEIVNRVGDLIKSMREGMIKRINERVQEDLNRDTEAEEKRHRDAVKQQAMTS